MWRTRFDQRGVRLPPAARQLLWGGMLVGLVCLGVWVQESVCVFPSPQGTATFHRHARIRPQANAVSYGESISSTMQFKSLNSQMKLSVLVGNLNCFCKNEPLFFFFKKFWVKIFPVYVHLASRWQGKQHHINQDTLNLRAAHFQTGWNSFWIPVWLKQLFRIP